MFPLGSVLLPGQVLPLHVFEPRYRQMIDDCLAADSPEFGVVLIERGSEVGGGDQRTTLGTMARIVKVNVTTDGRFAVLAVGTHRLRVLTWLPDDPYPLADVEAWPDEEAPDALGIREHIDALRPRVRTAVATAVELGDFVADPGADISDDPLVASYQLCGMAPLGPADRQSLLACPGPTARLSRLEELLSDVQTLLDFRMADPGAHDA